MNRSSAPSLPWRNDQICWLRTGDVGPRKWSVNNSTLGVVGGSLTAINSSVTGAESPECTCCLKLWLLTRSRDSAIARFIAEVDEGRWEDLAPKSQAAEIQHDKIEIRPT